MPNIIGSSYPLTSSFIVKFFNYLIPASIDFLKFKEAK